LKPVSKITRIKWTESVAQGVECLLSKCGALSSNPSQPKNKDINVIAYKKIHSKYSTNLKLKTVTMLGKHKKFNVTWCLVDEF
jgi:hypothetical protein